MIHCYGGFCNSREFCIHYHAGLGHGDRPAKTTGLDRLCGEKEEPIRIKIYEAEPTKPSRKGEE